MTIAEAIRTARSGRRREQSVQVEYRIMRDVVAELGIHGGPLTGDALRALVTGQGTRIDAAVRMLVAAGRVRPTRHGYALVPARTSGGADDAE